LFENGLDIYCTYVPWSKDSVWGDVHPSLGFHQSGYFFVHQPLLIGNHPPSIPNRDSIKWVYYMVKQSPINVLIVTHKSRCQGFTLGDVLHLRCFRQPSPRNLSKFFPAASHSLNKFVLSFWRFWLSFTGNFLLVQAREKASHSRLLETPEMGWWQVV
jgi:hypothetical protein